MVEGRVFNPPPGWPKPPDGWQPPPNWKPDPNWPPPPPGWELWILAPREDPPTPTSTAADAAQQGEPEFMPPPPPPRQYAPPAASPASALPTPSQPDDADLDGLRAEIRRLRAELDAMRERGADGDVVDLDDERVLQEVGIYRYHHPLENADLYRERLASLQERIREFVKTGAAILASDMFTYNNSLAKGRKMTSDLSKLMLRAYNAEADNCVRSLRAGNVITAKSRLDKAVGSIVRLGAMMEMRVNPESHAVRFEELELTADYLMKVQEEREQAREERERLREERRAEQELAAERERLDKERSHYVNVLAALREAGDEQAIEEMEQRMVDVDAAIAQNHYRTANIRAGYVYVISNPGSFGKRMVKIGMTRRLEPLDRVRELGDASVPFPFDVHALFFADDAVSVESELHKAFADARVNRVNERREFFFASPSEVRVVLADKLGSLLEFAEHPEATQYLQSIKYWPADAQAPDPTLARPSESA